MTQQKVERIEAGRVYCWAHSSDCKNDPAECGAGMSHCGHDCAQPGYGPIGLCEKHQLEILGEVRYTYRHSTDRSGELLKASPFPGRLLVSSFSQGQGT